ncbi:MAG TPA: ATP-binding cassette domain-containing protein [Candidatus Thermoplasmatota archaeon]|nr:ATP-binding cassette domain-containing protein [Candidatus Thermoplasmatota archaeon]
MIRFEDFSFAYGESPRRALRGIELAIEPGEFVLVAGPSGCGKSTLLRAACGLVPNFHGGRFDGRVLVDGAAADALRPRDLAWRVGLVFQDPEDQIVAQTVGREVAFGPENLALDPETLEARVRETLEGDGLWAERDRDVNELSGGSKQRLAALSVLAMRPRVLLLDEPTSALSPSAAQRLLSFLDAARRRTGAAVVLAEHRLDRVRPFATRAVLLADGAIVYDGPANGSDFAATAGALGLLLPETQARRRHADLASKQPDLLVLQGVRAGHGERPVLDGVDLRVCHGEVVALTGENGSGKTTLLRVALGLHAPADGSVRVAGLDPARADPAAIAQKAGAVFQNPNDHLLEDTVEREVLAALSARRWRGDAARREAARVLSGLGLAELASEHPRDLSGGERERVALAAALAGSPPLLLLDEPTRGLHAATKLDLFRRLLPSARKDGAVLFATHDLPLARAVADRVVRLDAGTISEEPPATVEVPA